MFNREKYNWNIVYREIMSLKDKYISINTTSLYEKKEYNSCVNRWAVELNDPYFLDLLSRIETRQNETNILFHYGDYGTVYGGEDEITDEQFWKMYDGFYGECRSLVIDIKEETIKLCPFAKFLNLNQSVDTSLEAVKAAIANACKVEISNKLDGSMFSVRYYNRAFISSTSQALTEDSWRLKDANSMLTNKYKRAIKAMPDYTFIFEFIEEKDRHVVCYKKEDDGLYLIGMRNVYTGIELSYEIITQYAYLCGLKTTEIFNESFENVLSKVDSYKSNEKEGWVINIIDKDTGSNLRIKLKVDDYVKMHRILSSITSTNLIIQNIADGKYDDLRAKIPESYRGRIQEIANKIFEYQKLMDKRILELYEEAPLEDRKSFMIWIDDTAPAFLKGYLKAKYLGRSYNFIKNQNNSYKNMAQINKEYDKLKGIY